MNNGMMDYTRKRSKLPFVLGCLGGGCLSVIVVVVGFGIYLYNFVSSLPEDSPTVTPVEYVQEEYEAFENRYNAYREAIAQGEVGEFEITPEEINMALSKWVHDDPTAPKIVVSIDGSTATGKASFPFQNKNKNTKWINCQLAFEVSVQNGQLSLNVKELKIKDKTFEENGLFQSQIQHFSQEALKDFNNDPKARKELEHVESIEVKDGKVHLKVKPGTQLK